MPYVEMTQRKKLVDTLSIFVLAITEQFCNYILLRDFNVNFCNYSHPFIVWHWHGYLGIAPGWLGLSLWMNQSQPSQSCTYGQHGLPRYSLSRWTAQTLLQTDARDLTVPASPAVLRSLQESGRREEPHNTVQGNMYIVLKKYAWLVIVPSNLYFFAGELKPLIIILRITWHSR